MRELSAEAYFQSAGIERLLARFLDDHDDVDVRREDTGEWQLRMHYGSLRIRKDGEGASFEVRAADDTCLSYMKMGVAGHVAEYSGSAEGLEWKGDGGASTTPGFFRELIVISSQDVSRRLRRVRFSGADIHRFAMGGLHVRLLFPAPGRKPVWPSLGANGLLVWPSGDDSLVVRVYTIRAVDAAQGWIDIDFVVHQGADTPSSDFAATAAPGQIIGMIGPGGGDVPEAGKLLLLGDDTALPAIARILESIPASTRADVLLEVDGVADRVQLPARDNIEVRWLYRHGRMPGTAELLPEALRGFAQTAADPDLYVWAGCEFSDFLAIRRILRKEWSMPKQRHLAVSYWRRGLAGHDGKDD